MREDQRSQWASVFCASNYEIATALSIGRRICPGCTNVEKRSDDRNRHSCSVLSPCVTGPAERIHIDAMSNCGHCEAPVLVQNARRIRGTTVVDIAGFCT